MAMNVVAAIKQLENYLIENSDEKYFVIGYDKQVKNALALKGKKMVQCVHAGGSFDMSKSEGVNGRKFYNAIASIKLTVSEAATVDLTALDEPLSTPEQLIVALGASDDAEKIANDEMDTLFGYMFDLIMGGDGESFGRDDYSIIDREGKNFDKSAVVKKGSLAVITGYFDIGFGIWETANGETPTGGEITINNLIDIQDDNGDDLEVETNNGTIV